jgi:probable HAF family extracellular repeat protein
VVGARDINDSGVVVGSCAVTDIYKSMPFVWENGKLTDLGKTVPGVELEEAVAINNRGAILVTGNVKQAARLYLLRPSN